MIDDAGALSSFAQSMKGRASAAAVSSVGASFDARVDHSLEAIAAGEGVVALQDLIANLYEYEVTIAPEDLHALLRLVQRVPVGPSTLQLVSQLGVGH